MAPTYKKTHVCLSITQEVCAMLDQDMIPGEKASILWRMEEDAFNEFKTLGFDWQQHIGRTGVWTYLTHHKEVTVHWRFEGLTSKRPAFTIGLMNWTPKPERCLERKRQLEQEMAQGSKKPVITTKARRFWLVAATIPPLLTLMLAPQSYFSSIVDSAGPAIEFLILLFGLIRSYFE